MKRVILAAAVLAMAVPAAAQLSVRLDIGDVKNGVEPSISVTGQTIDTLNRAQADELLPGGMGGLAGRVEGLHRCGRVDGVHLSDEDGVPGNLRGTFNQYNWRPATLTHRADGARILSVTGDPVVVADQDCSNPSSVDVASSAMHQISREVTNTVSKEANWDVSSTVMQTVSYEVGEGTGAKVGGETSLSFTAGYGERAGQSEAVAVGSVAGAKTTLDAGQAVRLELSLTRGQIEAQVNYRADDHGWGLLPLSGQVRRALSVLFAAVPDLRGRRARDAADGDAEGGLLRARRRPAGGSMTRSISTVGVRHARSQVVEQVQPGHRS